MTPDPTKTGSGLSAGQVISGHKISLNVSYNETKSLPSHAVKLNGQVTPLEEEIAKTGALAFNSTSSGSEILSGDEKLTHVDHVCLNGVSVEAEHRSIGSPLSEIRPDSPSELSLESNSDVGKQILTNASPVSFEAPIVQNVKPNPQSTYLNGPDQIIPTNIKKCWSPDGAVRLKIDEKPISSHTPISVPSFLRNAAEKYPDYNALAEKQDGVWKYTTYSEYYKIVRTVAKAYIKLGLDAHHGVCILGFNSPEWFISDLSAIFAGGAAAGIYTTNSPEACEHCAKNCRAQIFVVEDQKQLDKVLRIRKNLPDLKAIIQYKGTPTTEGVLSWQQVIEIGQKETDEALEDRLKRMAINQCCTLIYTSGTTGSPKGVMLSHDNMTWTALATGKNAGANFGNERIVSYLPLSHVAAQICDMYVGIYGITTVYFAQPDALKGSLGQTLKEVRPTIFVGVPRVWEKIHEKMMEIGKKTKGLKRSIATWAKALGSDVSARKQRKDYTKKPFGYSVARAVVFKKVQEALGLDQCRVVLSAAAPISPDIVNYFQSLDIPLTECYGMSESSGPHTMGLEKKYRNGSAGPTVPGSSTKIDGADKDGNGEICMGGRNVCMGYLRQEDKTHEAIDDEGWLRTGDIGRIDKDGFLFITGRIKELIITAGGENIPPVLIEDDLKSELPGLSNAMLIGDRRKFLSVLLTLKTDMDEDGSPLDTLAPSTLEWCRNIGSNAKTVSDVVSGPEPKIMKAIQDGIDRTNKRATSNAQKIQKWSILPKDFSVPGDELGPTLKLKRPVVSKKYYDTIEKFYN